MSLIQDALKRQQQESEDSRAPLRVAPSPSVPETMAVPPRPAPAARPPDPVKPEKAGKSWKQIAGIIIFFILLIWGGGLLAAIFFKQSASRALLGPLLPALTEGRVTPSRPPVHPAAAAMPAQKATPAAAPASGISLKAAAAPAFADEEEAMEEAAASEANESEAPEPVAAPFPAPVVWPKLKLSAIFSNIGSGQAGARLNNRLILAGDQIEGVVLVEIRRDGVMLKSGAETRFLKMGATLR